jgi:hypothetical protein
LAAAPLASLEIWKDAGHLVQFQQPRKLVARFEDYYALSTRKDVTLSRSQLARYAGTYTCFNRPDKVKLIDGQLVLEIPGDPYYWLFPATDSLFFLRTEKTQIEFGPKNAGKITALVIQNEDGSRVRCPRL